MVKIAQYGAWESPLTADLVAASDAQPKWVDLHDGRVWWAETRPTEGGRVALLREGDGGAPVEVLPAPWNVRNRVHEYGGRPWTVLDGRLLVFTEWSDQRLYVLDSNGDGEPRPITPEPERHHGLRYADLSPGPDGASVLCVRERVTGDGPTDIEHDLVQVPVGGGEVRVLGASHHFMSGPRCSPDGTKIAWIGWDHPRMPWDGAELCVATLGEPGHRVLAGGERESVCQVEWESPDTLLALTDPDGWWNLHRIGLDGTSRNLLPCAEELGGALWTPGMRWFATLGGGRHAVLRSSAHLAVLDEHTGDLTDVDAGFTSWTADVKVHEGKVVTAAGGPHAALAVVSVDLATGAATSVAAAAPPPVDTAYLPEPQERRFTSPDGRTIPAIVYPPRNPDFAGPDGAAPPLLVHAHGGPTGKVRSSLDLDAAFFTSRGFAYVSVNYGGSSGYGRPFRESLNGQWGVVDVDDCATVAAALAAEGSADPERLAIRGGSAGGWTSAVSMTTVDTYRCATIMYPILDMLAFVGETHDFESRYLDTLVGTLPEHRDRYFDRSPINHMDSLAGPVLLLQGLDDPVCLPAQADRFVAALDGSGLPHAYLTFEGEQHGFRRAETMVAALRGELSFYGQVFGFDTPGVPKLELRT
ncbi:MAG TPA: prolyl oligopeptidase family serine peptidase [Actinophytocola sp.]|uniref:dipeptidyl-peptidase 5 n=1 Tax=Actinophytocola sp. TaxID=1872138 RepID=UPI002F941EE3